MFPPVTLPRLSFEHHRSPLVDRQVAAEGQLQVVASEVSQEEADGQSEKGQGAAHVCDQAHSDSQRDPGARLHQPKEWG